MFLFSTDSTFEPILPSWESTAALLSGTTALLGGTVALLSGTVALLSGTQAFTFAARHITNTYLE